MKLLAEILGITEAKSLSALMTHPYYDHDEDEVNPVPSNMTDRIDSEEESEDDGYYWFGYIGPLSDPDQLFYGGVCETYNDAVYYAKRQVRQLGGNVTMNANFQIVKGRDALEAVFKELNDPIDRFETFDWKAS